MTDIHTAKDESPACRVRVGSAAGILAVVPHLLGFHPADSVVVLGIDGRTRQVRLACRYELPDPADASQAGQIAAHAAAALRRQRQATAIIAGYGADELVRPVADAVAQRLRRARIRVRDMLRVDRGRYWSYLCEDERCCPADGTAFDPASHPAAAALARAGLPARPDRAALAATLAPLPGAGAAMSRACDRALRRAGKLIDAALGQPGSAQAGHHHVSPEPGSSRAAAARPADEDGLRLVVQSGRRAVRTAIARYRAGGEITHADQLAWLGLTLTDLRVRDDAWARMDPAFREAHQRLWTCLVQRLPTAYAAAPSALLAFTAWQAGDGALASIAIDRALEADPGYSMARLIARALHAAVPPSAAKPPLTPRQVAASYRRRPARQAAGPGREQAPAAPMPGPPGTAAPRAAARPAGR